MRNFAKHHLASAVSPRGLSVLLSPLCLLACSLSEQAPVSVASAPQNQDAVAMEELPGSAADIPTPGPGEAVATYLANAGVLIADGDTKIVFDPLFKSSFGSYRLLPQEMEARLFRAAPPFDGLDAVFVSHNHGDHFSARGMLRLLYEQPNLLLFAPAQAVANMRSAATDQQEQDGVFDRVTAVDVAYEGTPMKVEGGDLVVEAVRIPHSGWPNRMQQVENIAFRVSLNGETTVLHLGDADTKAEHYDHDASYWSARQTDLAFPPYWYFSSENGRGVLEQYLRPTHSIGVHVPLELSNAESPPEEYLGFDLFHEPGETRVFKTE